MTKSILVIADIAGQFDALTRLVSCVPSDTIKVSVGDMCDRGPDSRSVFEYFMDGYGQGKFALFGNHEHMMLDYYDKTGLYEEDVWFFNGGEFTIRSFGRRVPSKVLEWVRELPCSIGFEGGDATCLYHMPPGFWNLRRPAIRMFLTLFGLVTYLSQWPAPCRYLAITPTGGLGGSKRITKLTLFALINPEKTL